MSCLDQYQKQIHFYNHDQPYSPESSLERTRDCAFGYSKVSNTSDYNQEDKEYFVNNFQNLE